MPGTGPLILLATSAATAQLTDDDRLLADALVSRGFTVRGGVWDDPGVEWARAGAVIVRSTWDYHLRREGFLAWAARAGALGVLHNEPALLRWNSHKGYLAGLSGRGIATIDTVFVAQGTSARIAPLARTHGWRDIVVKPAVSASAYETRRFTPEDMDAAQQHLERVARVGDVMVQPYLAGLGARGELSLVFARGGFSHAVRRRSALVDESGLAKSAPAQAPETAIRFAERVLATALELAPGASGAPPLYARADLAETGDGAWVLLELELIEPSLFFGHAPEAAERFAELIGRQR